MAGFTLAPIVPLAPLGMGAALTDTASIADKVKGTVASIATGGVVNTDANGNITILNLSLTRIVALLLGIGFIIIGLMQFKTTQVVIGGAAKAAKTAATTAAVA